MFGEFAKNVWPLRCRKGIACRQSWFMDSPVVSFDQRSIPAVLLQTGCSDHPLFQVSQSMQQETLFTIGHSSRTWTEFATLLRRRGIDLVFDIRSSPYSKYAPHFDKDAISQGFHAVGIDYAFFGQELGGRPDNSKCYVEGRVQYPLVAKTPAFLRGIQHLTTQSRGRRAVIMCSEKDPITCHRMLLVSRFLRNESQQIVHVIDEATAEPQVDAERRLLRTVGLPEEDLFSSFDELVAEAYDRQASRVAYRLSDKSTAMEAAT